MDRMQVRQRVKQQQRQRKQQQRAMEDRARYNMNAGANIDGPVGRPAKPYDKGVKFEKDLRATFVDDEVCTTRMLPCLPACLPASLPSCLPACVPVSLPLRPIRCFSSLVLLIHSSLLTLFTGHLSANILHHQLSFHPYTPSLTHIL